nr:hypothetical protein [Tanacetum cinerariifolium]
MSTQQDIYAAGSKNRPPMLNKENYVLWSSRLLRYAKSRRNGKLIHNSIISGPYVRRMIPEPGDTNHEVPVNETFHVQTDDELTEKELKQIEADDQAIQTILLGLPEDIYAVEKKAKLFNEWERFTSNDGESIESYYHRISSNPRNRQIAQPGMNMGQDRQMQMVRGNDENQFRQYAGQNVGNLNGYNDVQNVRDQNPNGNGNLVAARAEVRPMRRDAAYLQTQLLIAQKEEAGIQLHAEEFDLMAAAADLDEIKKVNANCILMANLQQASTSSTQTDKAPVYDSDGSAENDRVPSTSKSSCNKNKGVEVEEHSRNLLLSKNKKHMSTACNNVKLASQNVKSKVVCAMCKQCLISVNHDVCLLNYVNGKTSRGKKQNSKVKKPKKVGFFERLATPNPSKPRSFLRWSLTGRLFDIKGKIFASSKSESQSDCSKSMAFEQHSSKPRLQSMTSGQISSGLDLTYAPSTITTQQPTKGELDLLFEAMYVDYIGGQPSANLRTDSATQAHQVRQTSTTSTSIADTAPMPTNSSSQATNFPISSQDVNELSLQQQQAQQQGNQASLQPETIADNVPNAMFDANTFVNPFATSSTSTAESSSSQYTDGDMCMYALTVGTMEPKNVKEVMIDPVWIKSMQEELLQFKRMDVWVLVPAPDNISPLTLKWIFKNKNDKENTVIRNKSRFIDADHPSHVYKLKKALYRLKQAPRAWYDKLSMFHLQNHFFKGTIDPTLFIRRFNDDILVPLRNVNDGEMAFLLGLQVNKSSRGIFINQSNYVLKILKKYGMESCDPVGTLMEIKDKLDLDQNGTPVDAMKYRCMIGALMYLTSSRPDIVHATCLCARYQAKTTEKHLKEFKRIFRYLQRTIDINLWYTKDSAFELTGFSDADYAGCKDTFKSTFGASRFLGEKLVSWSLKKQDCTALSTVEAEYVSLSACSAQDSSFELTGFSDADYAGCKDSFKSTSGGAQFLGEKLLTDYSFNFTKIPIYCDSKAAIAISYNPVQHSRTKHIAVRYHFIKEHVEKGTIELYFVKTDYQLADIFTKALPADHFNYLVHCLGMRSLSPHELERLAKSQ